MKSLDGFWITYQLCLNDFECNGAFHDSMACFENLAHPAFSDQFDDLVTRMFVQCGLQREFRRLTPKRQTCEAKSSAAAYTIQPVDSSSPKRRFVAIDSVTK